MGKCGREQGCDFCAHEVDLHKSFAIFTGPRPDIVEATRQTELFNACATKCTLRQRSRFVGMVHVKGDGCKLFFPRVRTPCGHGAQVIIEGREIQSDGGEKDKDNPTTNQTKPTTAHRPRLHHQVVFPLY